MKNISRCTLLLLFSLNFIQPVAAQLSDDFSDGEILTNPSWTTSNNNLEAPDFVVIDQALQSNGPAESTNIWVSTPLKGKLTGGNLTWQFDISYPQAPSSSNNIRVYLLADSQDLGQVEQGYYLQLGESGSTDGIDLYKVGNGAPLISDSNDLIVNQISGTISVQRSSGGFWQIWYKETDKSEFTLVGESAEENFVTGNYFGYLINHTSSRAQSFLFDNVQVIFEDNSPPEILNVESLSELELAIQFNEELSNTSEVQDTKNYWLMPGNIIPDEVKFDENQGDRVLIQFSKPLENATKYTLHFINLEDLPGNVQLDGHHEFFHFIQGQSYYKALIFNEILVDFDPPNDLPDAEYIEIYNRSNQIFDLFDWQIADRTTSSKLSSYLLRPDSYVVLCDVQELPKFSAYDNVLGVQNLPSLNNSEDSLTLSDENQLVIDVLNYNQSWYKDSEKKSGGWSLELIDVENTCGEEENWKAATSAAGGTPGFQNSVYDPLFDSTPLAITSVELQGKNGLLVNFDQRIDTNSFDNLVTTINNGLTVENSLLLPSKTSILMNFSEDVKENVNYQLQIKGIADCSGNFVDEERISTFMFLQGEIATRGDLIINEIMADPDPAVSLPTSEYIELHNVSQKVINLDGWVLLDENKKDTLSEKGIFPGEFLILCPAENQQAFEGYGNVLGLSKWPGLNNETERIQLLNEEGKLIDELEYFDSWHNTNQAKAGGWSLEKVNPELNCDPENNWKTSTNQSGGTPGKVNSVFNLQADQQGPIIAYIHGINPNQIAVMFNEVLEGQNLLPDQFELTNSLKIIKVDYLNKLVILTVNEKLEGGQLYTLTIQGITDCSGNLMISSGTGHDFYLLEPAEKNDLIINEILFNPREGGSDFVEIYNRSEKMILIENWQIANGRMIDDRLEVGQSYIITDQKIVIEPGAFLVLTENREDIITNYPLTNLDNIIEVDHLPSFPNDRGTVVILSGDDTVIDYQVYDETYHSSLLDNVEGVSLERISTEYFEIGSKNWQSASTANDYATPGFANKQAVDPLPNAKILQANPPVIFPLSTSRKNFTTISYHLDTPGILASLTVFNARGLKIRTLAKNELLDQSGFYTWDGTDDHGQPVRMGPYLILFELTNPAGYYERQLTKVVISNEF